MTFTKRRRLMRIKTHFLKHLLNSTSILVLIVSANIFLRILFVFYGYIGSDEGAALYNVKLASSGLMPFIDYDGWNSLIHDYIIGIPSLFFTPTILSQRLFSVLIAMGVFVLSLRITQIIDGKKEALLTAFFLTFGSAIYLYFSNFPFSEQTMTLFIVLSIYCLALNKHRQKGSFGNLAVVSAVIAAVIRSQAIPMAVSIMLYLFIRYRKNHLKAVNPIALGFLTGVVLYAPFFIKSWQHGLYAIFWPFFVDKIMLYSQYIPSKSLPQFISFFLLGLRDYGIFFISIASALLATSFAKRQDVKRITDGFTLQCLIIAAMFILTGLLHYPIDSVYIYPAVPLLSIITTHMFTVIVKNSGQLIISRFLYFFLVFAILVNFLLFPHHKVLKTSLASINQPTPSMLDKISSTIEAMTFPSDKIISFYMPAVAQTDRNVLTGLNRGHFSISILPTSYAQKFHLTNVDMLKTAISSKEAKIIILTPSYSNFLGRSGSEQLETMSLINKNYTLAKEFPELRFIDGTNSPGLSVYISK